MGRSTGSRCALTVVVVYQRTAEAVVRERMRLLISAPQVLNLCHQAIRRVVDEDGGVGLVWRGQLDEIAGVITEALRCLALTVRDRCLLVHPRVQEAPGV